MSITGGFVASNVTAEITPGLPASNVMIRDATRPEYYGDDGIGDLEEDEWVWVSAVFCSSQKARRVEVSPGDSPVFYTPTILAVVRTPTNGEVLTAFDYIRVNDFTNPSSADQAWIDAWGPMLVNYSGEDRLKYAAGLTGCIIDTSLTQQTHAAELILRSVQYDAIDSLLIGPLVLDNHYYEDRTPNVNAVQAGRQTNVPGITMWIDGLQVVPGSNVLLAPPSPARGGPV